MPDANPKPKGDPALAWRYKIKAPWVQETFAHVQDLARSGATLEEVCADIGGWDEASLERELRKLGWANYTLFRSHCLAQTRARLRSTMTRLALSGQIPAATTLLARQLLGWGRPGKDTKDSSISEAEDEIRSLGADELAARLRDLEQAVPTTGAEPAPLPAPPPRKRGRPQKYRFPQPPNMPDPKVAASALDRPPAERPLPDPAEPLTGPRPTEPGELEIPLLDDDAAPTS